MGGKTLQIVGVILVVLLIAFAIANFPLWIPFLIVGIVLILLLFFGKRG
jgi:hypothetical protein